MKTEQLDGWAGFWLRVDGRETPNLFFDNMSGRPVTETTPWGRHRIEAVVPEDGEWLCYGIVLFGGGRLWADDLRLLVWDGDGAWRDI